MPKSDFKGKKKTKLKLAQMSVSEREQIKDPKARIAAAKAQEEKNRSRKLTQADIRREQREKEKSLPKIAVKVRPNAQQKPAGSTQGTKMTREEVQEKYFKRTLNPMREQLSVLVENANKMYFEQRELGIQSRAALEAERTLNKRGQEHFHQTMEPFQADLKSRRDINREFSRVMNFLSDYTSSIEGGMVEKQTMTHLFGGQWRKEGYAGYDEKNVSKEDADMVFDIYRRVLEQGGGWQRVIGYFRAVNPGVVDYGSENLINAIYDMVQNKDSIYTPEGMDVEGAILGRAMDIVNNMIDNYMRLAILQRTGTDYGSIEDREEAEHRRKVYEWGLTREKYKEDIRNGRNLW